MKTKKILSANMQEEQTKKCPQCGEEILKIAKKCKHCAAKVGKDSSLIRRSLRIIVFMLIVVLTFSTISNMGNNKNNITDAINVEQLKNTAESFEYDDLARFPEKYQGKYLYFTGEVIQKTDDILRVNITKGEYNSWGDTVYVILKDENVRILEDDIVKMWGVSNGNTSYTAIFGQKITIPGIIVYAVEVTKEEDPIVYQMGEAIDMEDRILTVHQVLDDYDFTSQNQFIVPKEGNKYFLIEVSITNNGSKSLSCWHGQFKLKDKNNYEYKNDVTFKEPSFGIGDLLPTRTKRGFITYEIPRNISDLELVYSSWSKQVIIKL